MSKPTREITDFFKKKPTTTSSSTNSSAIMESTRESSPGKPLEKKHPSTDVDTADAEKKRKLPNEAQAERETLVDGEEEEIADSLRIAELGDKRIKDFIVFDTKQGPHSIKLPKNWYCVDSSLVFRTYMGEEFISKQSTFDKVAAFDYDDCLVKLPSWGSMDHPNPKPVAPRHEHVIPNLRHFHLEQGYRLAIFSNENLVRYKDPVKLRNKIHNKCARLDSFVSQVQVPMQVFVGMKSDQYRKPSTKTKSHEEVSGGTAGWEFMELMTSSSPFQLPKVDRSKSLFVGDAAGRSGDHSDCDWNFARLLGVTFHTEELLTIPPPTTRTSSSSSSEKALVEKANGNHDDHGVSMSS